ncbi:DUF6479 family protein [Streptomyces griseoloalbus]|uniref:Secreted protein n=1 Tax=Streptomyces griseoloalbus TaxID=67303 RepID=A0A7W8FB03_9ACTN|nr:DUF6479 family protein [Streptomyces albaduncus]MBB5129753.1 hypothetical protein [Streptomyces albaduncus]GGV69471.1 hypothetical protein GCM10010294_26440 [Streptomyces griseoloalbus]GGW62644.1 hypothetical protein GCM10010340_46250 [Streptomyces albaduncus]
MNTATYVLLAASQHIWNVTAAFIGGLVVAGALIWAVRVGMRYMDQEEPRPRSEEQPRLPDGGAVREMREIREPDEMPDMSKSGSRLMPYELHHAATRTGKDQNRKRWLPGSSGAFGSGGPGHV